MSTVYFRIAARGPITRIRAPALERLLVRADPLERSADWRAEAFRLIAPGASKMPAIATAAARAVGAAGAWVCVATPVHWVAGMGSVSMPSDGILDLDLEEADALADDFNQRFADGGVRLIRGAGSLLLCSFDTRLVVELTSVEDIQDADVWAALPSGTDSGRVRRLMSEIEMWLFEHPVNERRHASALRPITGLWMWGGGEGDAPVPEVSGWTGGSDPLFAAFAPQPRYPDEGGTGVVVIAQWPGTPGWRVAEERWLGPALADLKLGRLRRIELSASDRAFAVSPRSVRRFWRRARPWWRLLGLEGCAG